jgi:hypothetical protein
MRTKPKKPKKEKDKKMVTWDVTIIPVSVGDKRADVIGVATDDTDPDNPITVSVENVPMNTSGEEVEALQIMLDRYNSRVSRNTAVDAWLSGKEESAETWLEART